MVVKETYHFSFNPFYLPCNHDCNYCYMKPIMNRFPDKFVPGFFEHRFEGIKNSKHKTIFIGSNSDYFQDSIPRNYIHRTIELLKKLDPSNTICFLTKNPLRYLEFIDSFNEDWLLGLTIESNNNIYINSKAKTPLKRIEAFLKVKSKHEKVYVMIEPLHAFECVFKSMIKKINPDYIIIGLNSNNSISLPEPRKEDLQDLINYFQDMGKIVITKKNISRLGITPRYGKIKKNIIDFKYDN